MADLVKFTLPRVRAASSITDKDGKAVNAFVLFWENVCRQIEGQENSQNATILAIQQILAGLQAVSAVAQAAQQAANAAQASADSAGGGTVTSGSMSGVVSPTSSTWEAGPLVNLTGVVAGPLTIAGSGPQQDDSLESAATITGEFRVSEIVGVTETVLFVGNFDIYAGMPGTVINQSAAAVAAFTSTKTSTGAVSYRMDARRTDGGPAVIPIDLSLYLFVRRA